MAIGQLGDFPRQRSRPRQGEESMNKHDDENDPIPLMQKLLDNPFLLLFLGVLVPMLLYNLWGVVDILTVPMAK
jgi:hypothetical protein